MIFVALQHNIINIHAHRRKHMKRLIQKILSAIQLLRQAGEASVLARRGQAKEAKKLLLS